LVSPLISCFIYTKHHRPTPLARKNDGDDDVWKNSLFAPTIQKHSQPYYMLHASEKVLRLANAVAQQSQHSLLFPGQAHQNSWMPLRKKFR